MSNIPIVNKLGVLVKEYWYILAIGILVLIVLRMILKGRKPKKEYHDEIKRHLEIVNKELDLNKTQYKKLMNSGKQVGKITAMKTNNSPIVKEITDLENPKKKSQFIEMQSFITLKVMTKSIGIKKYRLWFNPRIYSFKDDQIVKEYWKDTIILKPHIDLEDYAGYVAPTEDSNVRNFIYDNYHRTFLHHAINGMGNQMMEFSEVKNEWAYAYKMKEKELEQIKEEKRLLSTRSR